MRTGLGLVWAFVVKEQIPPHLPELDKKRYFYSKLAQSLACADADQHGPVAIANVCFTPDSDRIADIWPCPRRAIERTRSRGSAARGTEQVARAALTD